MINVVLMESLCLTFPTVSALICSMLCFIYASSQRGNPSCRYALLMAFTLIAAAFCWLGTMLFELKGRLFIYVNNLFLLVLMLDQVLLYRFVFEITGTGEQQRFNKLHYIIPGVIMLVATAIFFATPFEVQYEIFTSGPLHSGHPVIISMLIFSSPVVFCIYNIFYTILGFRRVERYRRVISDYSSESGHYSLRWLYLFMTLVLSSIPLPIAIILLGNESLPGAGLTFLCVLLPVVQYTLITYNLIEKNYVVIEPETKEESAASAPSFLDRRRFERYIKSRKPYLNPKLRITDMAVELGTNRSYLSAFINSEYGMNFNRYINRLRLEYLDTLRTSYPLADNLEKILKAGFNNYRSYLRVKQEEDSRRVIRIFRP